MDEPKREGHEATCYCVDSAGDPHQGCPQCGGEGVVGVKEQAPAIVQALAFRKWAYENNLVGPDGQPRKIIGTLPVTADGCVFGDGTLWHTKLEREVTVEMFRSPDDKATGWQRGWQPFHYKHCYSTREAAERAANRIQMEATDAHG